MLIPQLVSFLQLTVISFSVFGRLSKKNSSELYIKEAWYDFFLTFFVLCRCCLGEVRFRSGGCAVSFW